VNCPSPVPSVPHLLPNSPSEGPGGVIVGVGVRVGVGIGVGATVCGSDCGVTGIELGLLSAPPQPNRDSINAIASIGKTRVTRFNLLPFIRQKVGSLSLRPLLPSRWLSHGHRYLQ
jgi:hypothetical protein